jgi:[ribosomal protein S18]-alanine N-acetyltransferase
MADEIPLVRDFCPTDVPELTAIVEESPEAAAWAPGAAAKLAETSAIIYVAESAGRITGFVMGRQMGDEGEILNLAIRPTERRKGQAAALVHAVLGHMRQARITRVFLEVRESNVAAIALYERLGFRPTWRRRRYYRNPDEDALVFELKLTG